MKRSQSQAPQNAKCFKIRFSKLIIGLAIAVLAVCVIGVGVSIWRILDMGIRDFNDALKYPFFILICIFCTVLVISVLVKSQYIVKGKQLVTQFGFLKSKYDISSITSVEQDTAAKKLTVYFGEQFMVINISPEWIEKFIRTLLEVTPDIDYSFTLADNVDNSEKKDK